MPTPSYFSPLGEAPAPVSPTASQAQGFVIERAGDRDLAFTGWVIGHARECRDVQSGRAWCVSVTLFATQTGFIVAHACRWQEVHADPRTIAAEQTDIQCSTFARESFLVDAVLNWLVEDAGGKLGPTSKAAWEQACENWEDLSEARFERL